MSFVTGANPARIGKVVRVQVFKLADADTIDPNTMVRHVGVLELYVEASAYFIFKLQGGEKHVIAHKSHHVEIYSEA